MALRNIDYRLYVCLIILTTCGLYISWFPSFMSFKIISLIGSIISNNLNAFKQDFPPVSVRLPSIIELEIQPPLQIE